MSDVDAKRKALDDLRSAQSQLEAVVERMSQFRDQFRDERDQAIHRAVALKIPRKEIADTIGVTPQWINSMIRGTAYRRRED